MIFEAGRSVVVFTLELWNCSSYSRNYSRRDTEVEWNIYPHTLLELLLLATAGDWLWNLVFAHERDWNRLYDNQGDSDLLIVTAKTICYWQICILVHTGKDLVGWAGNENWQSISWSSGRREWKSPCWYFIKCQWHRMADVSVACAGAKLLLAINSKELKLAGNLIGSR